MILNACADCGELSEQSHCEEHRPTRPPKPYRTIGYDTAWSRLSRQARRLQPFCSACGTTEDLTADHTPEAWERKRAGKPIRLQDIDVLCRGCNSSKGKAR